MPRLQANQILLGDEAFISAHQQSQRTETPRDTPRSQRRAVTLSLEQFRAAELLAQQCFTLAILSVDMKAVFAENDADEHIVFHDGLFQK